MKKKVGFYSLTCCEGCTIVFIELLNKKFEEYNSKMEFVDFRVLKPFHGVSETDVAFVEGAVSTKDEVKKLKDIRKKTKKLIAFGSGAVSGYPSNQRNSFDKKKLKEIAGLLKKFNQIKKVSPLKEFVKVDDEINGCPVNEEELIKKIEEIFHA
jgi:sulfhydrogenase subunit delta